MSVMYNFKIDIVHREDITSIDIIKSYLEAGWSLYSERNHIIYKEAHISEQNKFLSKKIRGIGDILWMD